MSPDNWHDGGVDRLGMHRPTAPRLPQPSAPPLRPWDRKPSAATRLLVRPLMEAMTTKAIHIYVHKYMYVYLYICVYKHMYIYIQVSIWRCLFSSPILAARGSPKKSHYFLTGIQLCDTADVSAV